MTAEVSHGRGGAGNINADDTKYVDGEVVRTGVEGSHGDGAYSAGRGGAGNIGDVGTTATVRKDRDLVPEVATRPSSDQQDFHTGRGGAGNEHTAHDHKNGHGHGSGDMKEAATNSTKEAVQAPISLADKLKHKLFGAMKA